MSSELVEVSESTALEVVNAILEKSLTGFSIGPVGFSGPKELARTYTVDEHFATPHERVNSLIKWESAKNFTSGFVTGIGGFATLPMSIPAALGATWLLQARLVATIALLYGWDIDDDRVKTLILFAMVGDGLKEAAKKLGVKVGQRVALNAVEKIPGRIIIELNKRVGMRLLTKAGEKGFINLAKAVPLVGGPISGAFDASSCYAAGKAAKSFFGKQRRNQSDT